MDPRSLIGPTLLVFMLLAATVCSLFLLDPVEYEELSPEDYYSMSGAELKAEITRRVTQQMNRQLMYYAVIAVLICVVPIGNTNRITRGVILVGIGFVGKVATGDQAASASGLAKLCVLGGILIAVLFIIKLYTKAVDNGNRPASERWAPRRMNPALIDDPDSLAKLDRLRVIASGPPPAAS
ncbi:MAG: hypothetical protein O3B13_04055 [Planctomycetota bacterium]|nr:hypothetical protein [Planctomycetota bacterium]